MKAFKLIFRILQFKRTRIITTVAMFFGIFLLIAPPTSTNTEMEIVAMDVAIFDHDQSEVSKKLTSHLLNSNRHVDIEEEEDKIKDAIFEGWLDYAIIIPEGFQEALDQGQKSGLKTIVSADERISSIGDSQVQSFLTTYDAYRVSFGGEVQEENRDWILSEMDQVLANDVESKLIQEEGSEGGKQLESYRILMAFLIYPMISLAFTVGGEIITTMEEKKMKRRDVVSGFSEMKRELQVVLASFMLNILIWAIFLIPAFYFSGLTPWANKATQLMTLSSLVHVLATSALVLLLANIFPTTKAMNFFGTLFSVVISFATGVFVDRSLLWEPLLEVSRITPSYWDVSNLEYIFESSRLANYDLSPYYFNLLVMVLMTVAALLATVIWRRIRKQEA